MKEWLELECKEWLGLREYQGMTVVGKLFIRERNVNEDWKIKSMMKI